MHCVSTIVRHVVFFCKLNAKQLALLRLPHAPPALIYISPTGENSSGPRELCLPESFSIGSIRQFMSGC